MICRLCLKKLNIETAVQLFDVSGNTDEEELIKMIFKYLNLEISTDDFSIALCQDCAEHLEDFHRFSENVKQKQSELRQQQEYEFLEIKCEEATIPETINTLESLINLPKINEDANSMKETKEEFSEKKLAVRKENSKNIIKLEDESCFDGDEDNFDDDYDDKSIDNISLAAEDEIPLMLLKSKLKNFDLKNRTSPSNMVSATKKNISRIEKFQEDKLNVDFGESIEKMNFICDLCKGLIGNFNELKKHFSEEHKFTKSYVKCCSRKYTQEKYLEKHFERHRNPEEFKCHICNKLLSSKKYLKFHMRVNHEENEDLLCKLCGKVFNHQKRFYNHIRYHKSMESEKLNCSVCNKSYTSKHRLNRHIQGTHENFYPYKCSACNKPFNFKSDFDIHYENCENKSLINRLNTGEVAKEEENFSKDCICNICNKIFISPRQVHRHIESIHKNIHRHVCDQCGKKFKFKPAFEKHLREHSGILDPPVQCNICGNWLKNQHSLRLHLYRHDGSINKCHLCDRVCVSRRALRGHIMNVHRSEKNFKCNYCDKSFKSPKNLKEHIATHTGAQLYSCPHCNKETRSNSNMYVHIKRAHPEEWIKSKTAKSNDPKVNSLTQ